METKINYIIASYPGITKSRQFIYSEKCLDFQLEILQGIIKNKIQNNIDCLVKRITIIVTDVKSYERKYENYYKFEKWKNMFPTIEIIFKAYEGENKHHSYDQWIQGIIKSWDDFTHHIIIEDDYCIDPKLLDFDLKLVEIYKQKFENNIGYLSEKCGNNTSPPYQFHSWISNGMISSETMKKLKDPLRLFYNYKEYPQIDFSYLFTDNHIPLADYSDKFRVPFWNHLEAKIIDFSTDKNVTQACFIPVEELMTSLK